LKKKSSNLPKHSENLLESAIILLASFTFTIKLSAAPLCVIPFAIFIKNLFKRSAKVFYITSIICILFVVVFIIKSCMLSGYPFYPQSSFKLNTEWSVPKVKADMEKLLISNHPRHDFRSTDKEYIASYKWAPRYILKNLIYERSLLTTFLLTILLAYVSFPSLKKMKSFFFASPPAFYYPFAVTVLGMIFWAFTAPGPRFAYGFLFGFLFLISANIFYKNHEVIITKETYKTLSFFIVFFSIILFVLASYIGYDYYLGNQNFLTLILKYYDNLGESKLPVVFAIFTCLGFLVPIFNLFAVKKASRFNLPICIKNKYVIMIFVIILNSREINSIS
jgi:hypothetical protein